MVHNPNEHECSSHKHSCGNCNNNINSFKISFIKFLKNLENKLSIRYADTEKIKIMLKIIEKQNKNSCQCHAIVENIDGRTYQCTRKKKFGNLCGLHHNRNKSFKTIETEQKFENHQFYFDIYSLVCDNNSVNKNSLHKINYNYIDYLLDSNNGNVYLEDSSDYEDDYSVEEYEEMNDNEKSAFKIALSFSKE